MNSREILERAYPVMPVVEIKKPEHAKPVAEALLSSGITSIEITLRTPDALKAISELSEYRDQLMIGAGTVTNTEQLHQVMDLGVEYVISPGFSPTLALEAQKHQVNWIPGVSSASEITQAMEFGLDAFKLFPAEAVGGIDLLKALHGPFRNIIFCPTGGINKNNFKSYLKLPNVACVGGSWIAAGMLIENEAWKGIEKLANEAIQIAEQK